MEKYVVLIEKKEANGNYYDQSIVGIYDTEAEAAEKADEKYAAIPMEEKDVYSVEVGLISEDKLDDLNDWSSFGEVDILWEVEE